MSGQFLIHEKNRPEAKHVRAKFELSKKIRKKELVFNDQRTFGWVSVEETTDGIPSSAQHIAKDPFDPNFDRTETINKFAKRNIRIKTALLNQEIMSGVGNIYADETLWRAKVHPEISTADLTKKKIASIIDFATEVMQEAIAKGGTSFDDLYINVNGESGFFEQSLAAYGRTDEPCPRCGTPIRRITFGARSSHFCPRCQRKSAQPPRIKRPYASGVTLDTVMSYICLGALNAQVSGRNNRDCIIINDCAKYCVCGYQANRTVL